MFAAAINIRSAPVSQSAVASLKAIFSVLMGLSVTNTLVVLIRGAPGSPITPLSDLTPQPSIFAAVLLFTIVRFYLGNVRHVDDFYVLGTVEGQPLDPKMRAAGRFVWDFAVLLVQALFFGVASFYIGRGAPFTLIMMMLLFVDIIWTVATQGVAPHQRTWFINNLTHLTAITICYGFHVKYPHSAIPLYCGIGFLLTNGGVDFVKSRAFYFADRRGEKAVFLSAPFTQLLQDQGGGLPAETRGHLESIIDRLEARGWSVDNAHRRERWGAALDRPLAALTADLKGIETADTLVAIIGSPPSPGVQLEIGFALARGKEILLVVGRDDPIPYLIRGVIDRESVVLVRRSQHDEKELAEAVLEGLDRLRSTKGRS
jgi:hypothetical protein